MMRATRTIRFEGTPDEVLEFVFDDAITMEGEALEPVHESRERVGDSYAWTVNLLGTRHSGVTIITDYVPGQRLAFRNFGIVQGTAEWSVEPDGDGTRATARAETRLAIPLVGRFLDPLLERVFDKDLAFGKQQFEKRRSEATADGPQRLRRHSAGGDLGPFTTGGWRDTVAS